VLDRVLDLAEDEIVRLRTPASPPDLVLAPAVGDIGLLEFYRAADAIAAGRQAAGRTAAAVTASCPDSAPGQSATAPPTA
jgi:NTE family protein